MHVKVWTFKAVSSALLLFVGTVQKQDVEIFYCFFYPAVMVSAISFKQSQYICQWTAPHPKMQRIDFDLIIHNKNKRLINFEMDILFLEMRRIIIQVY